MTTSWTLFVFLCCHYFLGGCSNFSPLHCRFCLTKFLAFPPEMKFAVKKKGKFRLWIELILTLYGKDRRTFTFFFYNRLYAKQMVVDQYINLNGSFYTRRIRLALPFGYVLGFWVWGFVICFIIFGQILMKRLVSFRKLKISSGRCFWKGP